MTGVHKGEEGEISPGPSLYSGDNYPYKDRATQPTKGRTKMINPLVITIDSLLGIQIAWLALGGLVGICRVIDPVAWFALSAILDSF